MATMAEKKYNVGGVALDRPFKIRRLGHFGFNAFITIQAKFGYCPFSKVILPTPENEDRVGQVFDIFAGEGF